MAGEFPAFPAYPQYSMKIPIATVIYLFTFTWRERMSSWYLDVSLEDGTELLRGKRLSPSWPTLKGLLLQDAMEGVLFVRGPDQIAQEDFGREMLLLYYPDAELPAAPVDPDAPRVEAVP